MLGTKEGFGIKCVKSFPHTRVTTWLQQCVYSILSTQQENERAKRQSETFFFFHHTCL